MGKKKKGGGKSGGKSGGKKKKGKKNKEPEMTWQEALLAYKIGLKEKEIEDVKYEIRGEEELNSRHKERNERLKEEMEIHMKNLLKQFKSFEKELDSGEEIKKDSVIQCMMENWEAARDEDKNVIDLKEQIARKESEILMEKNQVKYWQDYKTSGANSHEKQIKLLEAELEDVETTFQEMSKSLTRCVEQDLEEISQKTETVLAKQKYQATESAMARLDKYTRQEVLDNDWLKREVAIHRIDCEKIQKEVEVLEQENLKIMGELFDCTAEDLKISREFFLNQFKDGENLDHTGILEMDLAQLNMNEDLKAIEAKQVERPQSATQRYIEQKVFSLEGPKAPTISEDDNESEFDSDTNDLDSEDEDPFHTFIEGDNFDDYLKLGPLELKLLNITGSQMPIYRSKTPATEELIAKNYRPDQWPVTKPMIDEVLRTSCAKEEQMISRESLNMIELL